MTYFGFLALFLALPLFVLILLTYLDHRAGRQLPDSLQTWSPIWVIVAHVVVAVLYTTPWDNYLVATSVWWYDPNLVSGILLGWVPLEEYLFFVLQTILTSTWLLYVARRMNFQQMPAKAISVSFLNSPIRLWSTVTLGIVWLGSVGLLVSGSQSVVYLALIVVWALPPIMLQLAFGSDILWHYRRLVLWTLVPMTLFLCTGDALAIRSGTWTIDPAQSTGILLLGLPIEEALFFFVTNVLVVFGVTLVLARESHQRAPKTLMDLLPKWQPSPKPASIHKPI